MLFGLGVSGAFGLARGIGNAIVDANADANADEPYEIEKANSRSFGRTMLKAGVVGLGFGAVTYLYKPWRL